MDLQFLTPLGGFLSVVLPLLGAGASWLVSIIVKSRKANTMKVVQLLQKANDKAEKDLVAERAAHEETRRKLNKAKSKFKAVAGKWREQLIANDLVPDPADWPEDEHD